jgi:hypothetical protein
MLSALHHPKPLHYVTCLQSLPDHLFHKEGWAVAEVRTQRTTNLMCTRGIRCHSTTQQPCLPPRPCTHQAVHKPDPRHRIATLNGWSHDASMSTWPRKAAASSQDMIDPPSSSSADLQSKHAAESVLCAAAEEVGLPVSVIRIGYLGADSRKLRGGRCGDRSLMPRLLATIALVRVHVLGTARGAALVSVITDGAPPIPAGCVPRRGGAVGAPARGLGGVRDRLQRLLWGPGHPW